MNFTTVYISNRNSYDASSAILYLILKDLAGQKSKSDKFDAIFSPAHIASKSTIFHNVGSTSIKQR